jgi:CheY-like chemotaxis protein
VLVFSSSVGEEDIQSAYNNHANGYITKPNAPDVLAAIVETIEQFWGWSLGFQRSSVRDGFHDQQLCSLRSWPRAAPGFNRRRDEVRLQAIERPTIVLSWVSVIGGKPPCQVRVMLGDFVDHSNPQLVLGIILGKGIVGWKAALGSQQKIAQHAECIRAI